jgi:hypothetical protein
MKMWRRGGDTKAISVRVPEGTLWLGVAIFVSLVVFIPVRLDLGTPGSVFIGWILPPPSMWLAAYLLVRGERWQARRRARAGRGNFVRGCLLGWENDRNPVIVLVDAKGQCYRLQREQVEVRMSSSRLGLTCQDPAALVVLRGRVEVFGCIYDEVGPSSAERMPRQTPFVKAIGPADCGTVRVYAA